MEIEVHYNFYKIPVQDSVLRQVTQTHTFIAYLR
jgi:hypothetical protein